MASSEATDHYGDYCSGLFKIVSVALAFVFWLVFTVLLTGFVPSYSIFWQYFFAGFTALSMAGVFFIALHMFWLVVAEQRSRRT